MERHRFIEIRTYFDHVDLDNIKRGIHGWRNTEYGIWGHSTLEKVKQLFDRLPLRKDDVFADLGSGDGRVVILASGYCRAFGIEGDAVLVDESHKHAKALKSDAGFIQADILQSDLSKYSVFFAFWDKRWSLEMEEKLAKCTGVLLNYSDIFKPERIKHENILWLDQTPCYIYRLPQELKKLPGDGLL